VVLTPLSTTLLIDSSAWGRMGNDDLPDSRADELVDDFVEGRLAVCLPFLLEAGISARNGDEHEALIDELAGLPRFSIDTEVERRAVVAQGQLARIGHHRVPLTDVVIAAIADRYEIGVLHYDKDFDLLLERTGLDFHSEWLMPRGSLS
jgi:predicted nucleic acid-binding protein